MTRMRGSRKQPIFRACYLVNVAAFPPYHHVSYAEYELDLESV